jgi:hypothetical protein
MPSAPASLTTAVRLRPAIIRFYLSVADPFRMLVTYMLADAKDRPTCRNTSTSS